MISAIIAYLSEHVLGFLGTKSKFLCFVLVGFLVLVCVLLLWQNQKLKNTLLEKENEILQFAKEAEKQVLQAFLKNEQNNKEHSQSLEEQKKRWEQESLEAKKMWQNKKEAKNVVLWTEQEIPQDVQKLLQSVFQP